MCCCLLLSSNLPKVSYLCMSESLKNSFLPNACFVEDLVLRIIFKAVVNPFLLFFFFITCDIDSSPFRTPLPHSSELKDL